MRKRTSEMGDMSKTDNAGERERVRSQRKIKELMSGRDHGCVSEKG